MCYRQSLIWFNFALEDFEERKRRNWWNFYDLNCKLFWLPDRHTSTKWRLLTVRKEIQAMVNQNQLGLLTTEMNRDVVFRMSCSRIIPHLPLHLDISHGVQNTNQFYWNLERKKDRDETRDSKYFIS